MATGVHLIVGESSPETPDYIQAILSKCEDLEEVYMLFKEAIESRAIPNELQEIFEATEINQILNHLGIKLRRGKVPPLTTDALDIALYKLDQICIEPRVEADSADDSATQFDGFGTNPFKDFDFDNPETW